MTEKDQGVTFFFDFFTPLCAAKLVKHVGLQKGQTVLDVACASGVVAVTAARRGGVVTGLDEQEGLLERGRVNARIAEVQATFVKGDAHGMPFPDATFDVVLSQFGHMFTAKSDITIKEMLRVLKPGGKLGLATYLYNASTLGAIEAATAHLYKPSPHPAASDWGKVEWVKDVLDKDMVDIEFDVHVIRAPYLSPQHHIAHAMSTTESVIMRPGVELRDNLAPAELDAARKSLLPIMSRYFDDEDNVFRFNALLTRATKR